MRGCPFAQELARLQTARLAFREHGHVPGVGGVEPREFEDLELSRPSMLEEELALEPWREYSLEALLADCCDCCSRSDSSLAGLGMNPTSQPSFTSRPIHQSLLNFCKGNKTRVSVQAPRGEQSFSGQNASELVTTTLELVIPRQLHRCCRRQTPYMY